MLNKEINANRSPTEILIYSTLRIERSDGGSGTGFVVRDVSHDDRSIPLLITNYHVLEDCDEIKLSFHISSKNVLTGGKEVTITGIQGGVIRHPNEEIDLVALPLAPILNNIQNDLGSTGLRGYIANVNSFNFIDEENDDIDAVEDVLMVGYPNGLSDEVNNHPLFRRGITATHPKSDFRNQPIGVVDIAAFPGSSGSPIYVYRRSRKQETQEDGNLHWKKQEALKLLGILYAGPQIDAEGEFDIVEIPNKQVGIGSSRVMMNLGYYVKVRELKVLLDEIYADHNFVPVDVTQSNSMSLSGAIDEQRDSTS